MARRFRWRRVAKWVTALLCFCAIPIYPLSVQRYANWMSPSGQVQIELSCGIASFLFDPSVTSSHGRAGWESGRYTDGIPRLTWKPRYDVFNIWGSRSYALSLPFWIPHALLVATTVVLFYRDRRMPPSHCQTCGYNLTGNTSGKCPECGERPPKPD